MDNKETRIEAYKRYSIKRDRIGLTDYAVAKETELPQSVFSDWKAGRSMPKIIKMLAIAEAVGTTVEYIAKG